MADKRINALANTASSTASDDFIAVDGTTNGTRKLNAFSPTFGGNATVTGTLTVNGTTASVGAGTGSIISKLNGAAGSYKLSIYQSAGVDRWYAGLAAGAESGSDGGAPYSIVALTDAGAVIDNALLITRAAGGSITTPRPVSISATTASTTTSSGALVVSGGLGVGGAIYAGGNLTVNGAGPHAFAGAITINPSSGDIQQNFQRSGTGKGILAVPGTAGNIVADSAVDDFVVRTTSGKAFRVTTDGGSTSSLSVTTGNATFAGTLNVNGDTTLGDYVGDADVVIAAQSTGVGYLRWRPTVSATNAYGFSIGYDNTNAKLSFLRHDFSTAGVEWLSVARTTGNATFAGTLTANAGISIGSGTFAAGKIYTSAVGGMSIGAQTGSSYDFLLASPSANTIAYVPTGTDRLVLASTTASTSTSSGALVVSGGVGVAGKISAGGDVVAFNDSVFVSASTWVGRSDGTNASLYLRANGTGKVIVDTGTGGLDVSAGPIRTAAPSGGTAANWKLGSVATVSPTSPNRTIEVDIGGTIYYIAAKTTNN